MSANATLDAALDYAGRGWSTFPCQARGKAPLTPRGFQDASADAAIIRAWWQRWPSANVAIATGASGLVVLDVDVRNGVPGLAAWQDLKAELNLDDDTLTAKTPTGGLHIYYGVDGLDVRNSASKLAPGLDVRAAGGYIVAPPSVHPSGGHYVWASGRGPGERCLLPLPVALAERLLALNATSRPVGHAAAGAIPEGARNDTLTQLAGAMRRKGATPDAIRAALLAENAARCSPPLSEDEVRAIAASVGRYESAGEPEHLTDVGNARRFAHLAADRLRHVHGLGWLYWDGRRWTRDTVGAAMRVAREVGPVIYEEASTLDDPDDRKAMARWAMQSESVTRLKAMLALAESEPALVVSVGELDANPMLFNCANGTLDLSTEELRPHRPADLLTKCSPVAYEPAATHPAWAAYLATATGGDAELAAYLQRAAGYTLTGRTDEEVLFLLLGPTATGKSTLAEALLGVLGDYGKKTTFETLLERRVTGAARNDLADLAGARLAVASETGDGRRMDAPLVKELLGGDTITARHLYHEAFSYRPQLKLWLATNAAPAMPDDDEALWRRLRRLPFEHTIPEGERDPRIKATLCDPQGGAPAVLAWAVRGCLAWQREGLGYPNIVRAKTKALRESFDPLADFLSEYCQFDPLDECPAVELREAYECWARETGTRRMVSNREWSQRLTAAGYQRAGRRRDGKPYRVWVGVRLAQQEEEAQEATPAATDATDGSLFSETLPTLALSRGFSEKGPLSVASVAPQATARGPDDGDGKSEPWQLGQLACLHLPEA